MATVVDDKYSAALSIILGSLAVAVADVVSQNMHVYNISVQLWSVSL